MYIALLVSLILLIFILSFIRKKAPSAKLQFLTHVLLYSVEILIVTKVIIYFIGSNSDQLLLTLKDYVFAFTLYQLLLLVTFKLKDSLDVDAYSLIKAFLDRLQLYAEFDKKIPDDAINVSRFEANNTANVFTKKQRKEIISIVDLAEKYNKKSITREEFRFTLKESSILLEKDLKIYGFGWMNSVLLRIFK